MAEYGIQMYSIRDITKENLGEALCRVAKMGYRFVEFAGFFGNSAEQVKAWLDEYGLEVSGTHTPLTDLDPAVIDETIAYHKAIGCKNIIVPGAKWETEEQMSDNINNLNWAQKRLEREGLTLSYHNHSHEFYTTPYGKVVEDEIIARTSLTLEIDTFWVFNAGLDPVAYCEGLKDRIRVIHLKDGNVPKDAERDYATANKMVQGRSLGQGDAPVKAVRRWADENGIPMVVESEGLDPTGPEEVARCICYLRAIEKR